MVDIFIKSLWLKLIKRIDTFDEVEQNEKQYIQNNKHHQRIARIPNG
jgi:hypothetical protein